MNTRKKNARKIHARNLLVSVLMLVCVILSACLSPSGGAPAATATQAPTSLPPTQVVDTASPVPAPLSEFPDAGEILETVPLPVYPNRDSVYAFDSLWLPTDYAGTVTRWDPINRQVLATITVGDPHGAPYGDPVAVVATTDSIWVTSVTSREIVRIDPNTNQITERIPLGQVDGRDFVTTVMVSDDSNLWVWDYDRGITLRIDLKTKQVAATIPNVTGYPATVADGSFWAWDAQHPRDASNLLRIDPATDQILAKIPLSGLTTQNVSSENSLWLGYGSKLLRIDTQTNQVIASLDFGVGIGVGSVREVVGDTVWATVGPANGPPACHDVQRTFLVRMDPKTNTVVGKIGLECPWGIFQIENTIWTFAGLDDSTFGNLYAVLIRPNEAVFHSPENASFRLPLTITYGSGWETNVHANAIDIVNVSQREWWGGGVALVNGAQVADPAKITDPAQMKTSSLSDCLPWPDDFFAYVTSIPGIKVMQAPTPVTIGGIQGTQIVIRTPEVMHTMLWLKNDWTGLGSDYSNRIELLILLDVNGELVLLVYDDSLEKFDEHYPLILEIFNSITFGN